MYVIIGNGIAGINCAEVIRQKDKENPILVITEEKYPYYSRPQIIEFLAGNVELKELPFYTEKWYQDMGIKVNYGEKALRIDAKDKILETDKETYRFQKLLISTGASPTKPPIENINAGGVFTLRNIDDAIDVLSYIKGKEKAIILGCGLLGIETGRALAQRGLKIAGIEFFPRLLPRQLDEEGANILQKKIEEKFGFEFYLGVKTKRIIKREQEFIGLELEDGRKIEGDLLIISAGISPNIALAQNSQITVNKGIIVNEYMETNIENIYAAGDCAEFSGRIYGIIPAALEQSQIVGKNMIGERTVYKGTIPSNTLKVTGIDLTSIGEIMPEGTGYEILKRKDEERGLYRKLIFKENILVGAILLGDKRKYVNKVLNLIKSREEIKNKEELINEEE
ncbi:MAG TPA: FAD-dependent oxidoreductase [Dictyoglomaceae bacterium]|nr:FAD-dependent oxidoreductase [Dictyoglomaceae bacterium]HOL39279.1 FAD-dependent oxidoreductase [Dictyoglomaceae bacterium]HPP15862.1 FAD-dependent oxidoreductase [Dictyoglomaceae bacterium]